MAQAGEEKLGAKLPALRKLLEDPANRAGVPACAPGEEDEFYSDNLDRLKWRVRRRVYNASNTHSPLCINTPVTSSASRHACRGWEEISFLALEQVLFFQTLTRVGVLKERCCQEFKNKYSIRAHAPWHVSHHNCQDVQI